ncbi:MAG: tripartite tricarboxylate transporter substrate binding protein, partial [Deltaproteobacteria bacterium]|nr:tripartite tricarboxylate transporter substrate binding protein [Deltaproteobacteria bacterium]
MNRLKLGVVVVLAMGFLWQSATTVLAEDKYPSKQINWYIHSSAGGGTDIFSRTVALRLRRILKANIVISTMSGGSGARMLNYLMEQPADGYTLNSFTNSNLATMARGMTTASRDDVIGIVRGCYDPQSL